MTNDPKNQAPPRPPAPPRPAAIPSGPSIPRPGAGGPKATTAQVEEDLTADLVSMPAAPAAPKASPVPPPVPAASPFAAIAPPAVPSAPPAEQIPPPPGTPFAPVPDRGRPSDRSAEARNHNRLPFEIQLDIVSEHNFYAGLTLNISEGGLFVATHVSYPVGTKLEIRMLFPGDEEPSALMTEVRWTRPHGETRDAAPGGMGLRFVDVSTPILEKIARFAKKREPLYYEDD